MANNLKIHPEVDAVIKPIVYDMTKIHIAQQTNPIIGVHNEPDSIKEMKKKCVHIIFKNGEYSLSTKKNAEGKLVCEACNRVINTKFDNTAVQKITDCIEVVNQTLLFGMLNGLRAQAIMTLISIKSALPAVAQLQKELNEYVKRENSSADSASNIGAEYVIPNYRSITEM